MKWLSGSLSIELPWLCCMTQDSQRPIILQIFFISLALTEGYSGYPENPKNELGFSRNLDFHSLEGAFEDNISRASCVD